MKIAFVMEIGLGHTTAYQNLRAEVDRAPDIEAVWIPITFERRGVLARLPKIRNDIVLRAGVQAYTKLRGAMRRHRFDALFFHTQMPSVLCSGLMRRIPTAISLDSTPKQFLEIGWHYGLTSDPNSALERRNDRWYRRAFAGSRRITAWSGWAARSVVEDYGVDPARVLVFPQGVDLTRWKPRTKAPRAEVRLLFVGGDFRRKGGDLLLRWMRECAPPHCSLDIVSRDAVPRDIPGVTVHADLNSNDPRLVALYQDADLFVLPTRADCYSLVAIEAMATGLPVVISRMGGIPEIIQEGETGYLLEPDDYASLTERLGRLVTDPLLRARMGDAARARAEALYSQERNLKRQIDALRAMAGLQRGGTP